MVTIIFKIIQDRDFWDWLIIICSPLAIVITFFIFRIGLRINKITNNLTLEKQFNKVNELFEKLQNTKIPVDIYSENGLRVVKENELVYLTFFQISTYKFKANYGYYNIIINRENYEKELSFINYKNDLFLLKQIADVIQKLHINLENENKIDIENKAKYTEIIKKNNIFIGDTKNFIFSEMLNVTPEIYLYSNKNIHTLNDFINILIEIHNEIKKWINKPSKPNKSLNLK